MTTIRARELHAGLVLREHDWALHVRQVAIDFDVPAGRVAIVTAEFPGFALHRRADELVDVDPAPAGGRGNEHPAGPDGNRDEQTEQGRA